MSKNFGWEFWKNVEPAEEQDGWKIYRKDGYVTECGPGQVPGDADCPVWRDDQGNPYTYK